MKKLLDWYPHSSLPKIYLSFAYDECHDETSAESYFAEVLESPGAAGELATWRKEHPNLKWHLETLAVRRDHRAKSYKGVDQPAYSRQNMLAKRALELSRAGPDDPVSPYDSEDRSFDLALLEDRLDEHEAAYVRADRAITSLLSEPAADYAAEVRFANSVFRWYWIRIRAATKLADQLRKERVRETSERAVRYLQIAEKDIVECRRHLNRTAHTVKEKHFVMGLDLLTLLTRAETEIDLGHLDTADTYFRRATSTMANYERVSRAVEKDENPRYLIPFTDRLKEAQRRLDDARALSREDRIRPTNSSVATELSRSG